MLVGSAFGLHARVYGRPVCALRGIARQQEAQAFLQLPCRLHNRYILVRPPPCDSHPPSCTSLACATLEPVRGEPRHTGLSASVRDAQVRHGESTLQLADRIQSNPGMK